MTVRALVFLSLIIFFTAFSWAETSDLKQFVLCKNQKIVRSIHVKCNKEDLECNTFYTKDGKERNVGSNNNILGGKKILDNIKKNLEEAGWKCSDITAKISIDG